MKNIWLLCLIVPLSFSCIKHGNSSINSQEQDIEFTFLTPVSYATTPGTAAEKAIEEVDVLVFKNDEFLYRRVAWRVGSNFRSTLKIDTGLTLYFIANSRSIVADHPSLVENESWATVRTALLDARCTALVGNDPLLPMWGVMADIDVREGIINRLGTVTLLRSVASVNVAVATSESNFQLLETYVYFAPERGYIAPAFEKFDPVAIKVSGPETPPGTATNVRLEWHTPKDNAVTDKLYLFENDADGSTVPSKKPSRVVVGGKYNGSQQITYYPLDFYDGENILKVTRNHKYRIVVTGVNAEGWPTPEEASEAPSVNIDYEVQEWEEENDEDIIVDGPDWISAGRKYAWLERPAGSQDLISFTTNIAIGKFRMSLAAGNTVTSTGTTENDRFRTELVEEDNKITSLRVTALQAYNTTDRASNFDTLTITSGRIRMSVYIAQQNYSGNDWESGGNEGIDFGQQP